MAKIGILVGSLRKESFSRQIAAQIPALLPKGVTATTLPIADLPFYNQDFDTAPPIPEVEAFRNLVAAQDAILFVTPEYNRSVPAVLKNALDTASRPYGMSKWQGKPAAIIGNSPGAVGGFGAYHHLKQSLGFLDMHIMHQPEVYLSNIAECFATDGSLMPRTRDFLQDFLIQFAAWID